jgi:hypothetical protein
MRLETRIFNLERRTEQLEIVAPVGEVITQQMCEDAYALLASTMAPEHFVIVDEYCRLKEEWMTSGIPGSPENPAPREGRGLGERCLDLLSGFLNDSSRPLAMPPQVAQIYLQDPRADHLMDCVRCGYETPVRLLRDAAGLLGPRPDVSDPACNEWSLKLVSLESQALDDPALRLDYFTQCPLCGGEVSGRPYPMECTPAGSHWVGRWSCSSCPPPGKRFPFDSKYLES